MKDNGMSVLYHLGKANVVVDALSPESMDNVSHIEEEKMELVHDVHTLARLNVRLKDSLKGVVMIRHYSESSIVVDVNSNKHLDPILMKLKSRFSTNL